MTEYASPVSSIVKNKAATRISSDQQTKHKLNILFFTMPLLIIWNPPAIAAKKRDACGTSPPQAIGCGNGRQIQ